MKDAKPVVNPIAPSSIARIKSIAEWHEGSKAVISLGTEDTITMKTLAPKAKLKSTGGGGCQICATDLVIAAKSCDGLLTKVITDRKKPHKKDVKS